MPQFEIAGDGDYLKVQALHLEHEHSDSDWDNNWVRANVGIKAGGFTGYYEASFMTTDFEKFKQELKPLYDKLKGSASFHGLDDQLDILVNGDGLGHFTAKCTAHDVSGYGRNTLEFEIDFDQTRLPNLIQQLSSVTKVFPITGNSFTIKNE